MNWDDNLLPDQEKAASHIGTPARLLAGPGTGKTLVLTRRILYLINEKKIPPEEILALTFTRAAAQELRKRVEEGLDESIRKPHIYTMHAFALRQLLKNSKKINRLPQPLRIADDWEEQRIIHEDLKNRLGKKKIGDIKKLFNQLSSDWETLVADSTNLTPDPKFIGAWQEHRKIFGYTLRSELVYQLKRALGEIMDFELEKPLRHLMIDEFQDLNKCDLAVIDALTNLGLELYVAGDDDQSIYGFRNAQPDGIRNFLIEHPGSTNLSIEICKRCDSRILEIAQFVADLDTNRIPKKILPEKNRENGEVAILSFNDQKEEAEAVASLCEKLSKKENYRPSDILILSRVNTNNAFSRILDLAFQEKKIPFSFDISQNSPLDEREGRILLSILRLLCDQTDNLAWRTVLRLKRNRIGDATINSLIDLCYQKGFTFFQLLTEIQKDSNLAPKYAQIVIAEFKRTNGFVDFIRNMINSASFDINLVNDVLDKILLWATSDLDIHARIKSFIDNRIQDTDIRNIQDLLLVLGSSSENIEQEINPDAVNMLTMHKAKGLSSKAVIIIAAEDELIPGRQNSKLSIDDERRLLFVSLTRAKHKLFITYCNQRNGQQMRLGRNNQTSRRTLTQFLRDIPVHPQDGVGYIENYM